MTLSIGKSKHFHYESMEMEYLPTFIMNLYEFMVNVGRYSIHGSCGYHSIFFTQIHWSLRIPYAKTMMCEVHEESVSFDHLEYKVYELVTIGICEC